MMTPFAVHVSDNLRRCCRYSEGRVIVALSGGADSVALLLALSEAGIPLIAAHCNFGLRGDESDADELFVNDLCHSLGIRLHILRPDVNARMAGYGESLEMACRSLRYDWFARLLDQTGASCIAVAHHRDDNVETFFLNILRGSGITGLRGMRWRRDPAIVRPMLDITRAEIESFLRSRGREWRTDSSNSRNDVLRNRIRNIVMPALRSQFEDADERVAATIGHLSENEELYRQMLAVTRRGYELPGGAIDVARLSAEPHAALMLWEWLRGNGMNRMMAEDIVASPMRSGVIFGSYLLNRGVLEPYAPADECVRYVTPSDGPWTMDLISPDDFHPERDPWTAYFDGSILDGDAVWQVRSWRRGDRVRPFGMSGSRLVSDVFSDRHLSLADKARTLVVTRDDVIVWIPGVITTAHFPVTGKSSVVVLFRAVDKRNDQSGQ